MKSSTKILALAATAASLVGMASLSAHPRGETHRHTMNYTATAGQDYTVVVKCGPGSTVVGGGVRFPGSPSSTKPTVAAQYISHNHNGYLVVTRRIAAAGNYEVKAWARCVDD